MRVYLQDCIETVIDNRGVTPHKRGTEWQDSGVMVLSANNVKTTGLQNMDQVRYIPDEIYDSWMKIPLERGDIILTSEAPAGEVYYWDSDEKVVLGQRLYGLKIKKSINSKYLKYYLQSEVGQKAIRQQQSGSTVFGISASTFQNIVVELPSKSVQDRIAQILSAIDDRITNNNAICAELEAMAKLLYDYWFVQFDFPDENGKPYKSSGGKMVWSEELKREIPEGWEIATLEKYIKVIRGVAFDPEDIATIATEGYTPLLKSNNLQDGKLLLDDIVYVKSSKVSHEQHLRKGSIFITMSSGSTEHVGKTAVISYDTPYCYGAFCSKIEIHPNYRAFLSVFFRSDYFSRKIRTIVVGTSIKNINNNHLINNALPLPPANVLERYEQIVCPMLDQQGAIVQENQELAALRDFLLPLLMNGQVVINSDE